MTPKNPEVGLAKAAPSLPAESPKTGRKVWKRKTPVEVMIDQIDRLRDDVSEKEEELKQAKRQLAKLEEARKVLEAI